MKIQYHLILNERNPREKEVICFLEKFKETRGVKAVILLAIEKYISGECTSDVHSIYIDNNETAKSVHSISTQCTSNVHEAENNHITENNNTHDTSKNQIPDDIMDFLGGLENE